MNLLVVDISVREKGEKNIGAGPTISALRGINLFWESQLPASLTFMT